jgi:YD repeat-containing protein
MGKRRSSFSCESNSNAASVDLNVVLSQTQTKFDANGNALFAIAADRLPAADVVTTGSLSGTTLARVSYSGAFYDGINRITHAVDWGTTAPTLTGGLPSLPTARASTFHLTDFGYDPAGNQSTVTDAKGIVTKTLFDALSRTTQTIENFSGDGTPSGATNRTTALTYNGDDEVLTQTAVLPSSQHQTTAYLYGISGTNNAITVNNLLAAVEYPNLSTGDPSSTLKETYTRDATGAVSTFTDRNGTVHAYTRDSRGRLTEDHITTFGSGVDTSIDKHVFGYDTAGNANSFKSYNGSTLVNSVTRTHNGFGQVLSETQTNGTNSATVNYGYDTAANGSRLTSMTYPNGRVLNYNYTNGVDSAVSRLSSISDSSGTLESYGYLGNASALTVTRGNGIVGTSTLDNFGNVANLNWTKTGTGTVDDFSYTYDPNRNVLSKKNGVVASLSELYAYDQLDRLITFNRGTLNSDATAITTASTLSGHSRTWTLDPLGNQSSTTTDGTSTTRTSNKQNELTQVGSNNLAYDANGNQTTDENGNTLEYDAWNQLVKIKSGSTTLETLDYDAIGRRIAETASVTTNLYYSTVPSQPRMSGRRHTSTR